MHERVGLNDNAWLFLARGKERDALGLAAGLCIGVHGELQPITASLLQRCQLQVVACTLGMDIRYLYGLGFLIDDFQRRSIGLAAGRRDKESRKGPHRHHRCYLAVEREVQWSHVLVLEGDFDFTFVVTQLAWSSQADD